MSLAEWLYAAALLAAWGNGAIAIVQEDKPLYAWNGSALWAPRRGTKLVLALGLTAVFLGLVALWADDHTRPLGTLLTWGALLALRRVDVARWQGDTVVRLGRYAPAAAGLLGWGGAWAVARLLGLDAIRADTLGWHAASGVLAGCYGLAALAKLRETGLEWLHPRNHALLLAERSFVGPRWLRRLRWAAASNPAFCRVVGAFGLAAEALGLLFVVPALRVPVGAGVLSLFAGIVLFLGYVEVEWWLVTAALMFMPR